MDYKMDVFLISGKTDFLKSREKDERENLKNWQRG